jgi:hypothetical protein
MSALSIQVPYPVFTDTDGQPLDDGDIYIGVTNLNPVNNPIAVFWDAALTIPAAQPVKTSGGYPVYQGSPARLYVNSDYSILVKNKKGITLYSAPSATERYSEVVIGDVDASNILTIADETGAIARTQESLNNDTLSVFDFMTPAEIADVRSNLAGVNVTTALQTAINAAAASGKRLLFPAGRYLTNGLVIPNQEAGRVFLDLDTKAVLQAASAGITVINMGEDFARLGPRIIRGGRIDGMQLAGVIGIQIGNDPDVNLYARLQDVTIFHCDEGVVVRNGQEIICDGLICFANTVGFVALSTAVAGGCTMMQFYGCRFQNNRVNFFGRSNSVFPVGDWLFSGCTFQNGLISGLALYGGQSGNGFLTGITLQNCFFEGSGVLTNPGDTQTVRGQVVQRSNIFLTGTFMSASSGQLGANILPETFILRENSVLSVQDGGLGGGTVKQFDCDATSVVFMDGANYVTGSGENVQLWQGWNWDGLGSGGVFSGAPVVIPTAAVPNQYAGTGLFPNAPEAGGAVGASVSKVLDQYQGLVQRIDFLASVGSTAANRVLLEAVPMAFAIGDRAAVSMLVRSSVETVMTFVSVGGTSGLFSGMAVLRPGWQRIVLYGRAAANEPGGYNVFMFPADDAGATVDLTKMMVVKTASADGSFLINAMVRNSWYDDLLSPIYGDAIPASGTYPRGKQIIARAPSVGASRGWVKVTQGSTNVLGVDWINLGNL